MRYQSTHNERDRETGYDFRNARSSAADVVRFGCVDPLEGQFVSWSPYPYVMGNPLRVIDPSGMRTYFVDEEGNHLYTSDDNEADAVTVINDVFSFNFYRKWVWESFGCNINDLRNMGVSYLLKEIRDFDNTPNPIATDEEGSKVQRYKMSDTKLSNPLGTAFAENGAYLYVMGNSQVVHVGKAYSDGNYVQIWERSADDKSTAIPVNAKRVGKIHDHPNWRWRLGLNGNEPDNDYLKPGPSGTRVGEADRNHSRTQPYFNIVVEKETIYFYGKTGGGITGQPLRETIFSVPLNPF